MTTLTISKFSRTVTAGQYDALPGEVSPSSTYEIPVPGAPVFRHSSAFLDGCRLHELLHPGLLGQRFQVLHARR